MQVSFTTYFMIVWTVGAVLVVALFAVDDRIVQHVCRKERRTYSWQESFFDAQWVLRKLSPRWFREAKDGGYLKVRIALVPAFFGLLVGTWILARSGLAPQMPPPRGAGVT